VRPILCFTSAGYSRSSIESVRPDGSGPHASPADYDAHSLRSLRFSSLAQYVLAALLAGHSAPRSLCEGSRWSPSRSGHARRREPRSYAAGSACLRIAQAARAGRSRELALSGMKGAGAFCTTATAGASLSATSERAGTFYTAAIPGSHAAPITRRSSRVRRHPRRRGRRGPRAGRDGSRRRPGTA